MPTRAEITDILTTNREKLLARYRSLTPEELERVCTQSEEPGGAPWNPRDHLAHLANVERSFIWMINRALAGHPDPTGFRRIGERPAIMSYIHHRNQKIVGEHHEDDLETLLADLAAVRAETLALLESLADEQLATPVPGDQWSDGTVGGMLTVPGEHDAMHLAWVEEGLHSGSD
ncbi:MAG TPA: DinB family protein [Ktedonobacterales bacterium]|nr:DinB family protein [Ktedonobacterales bacterium]